MCMLVAAWMHTFPYVLHIRTCPGPSRVGNMGFCVGLGMQLGTEDRSWQYLSFGAVGFLSLALPFPYSFINFPYSSPVPPEFLTHSAQRFKKESSENAMGPHLVRWSLLQVHEGTDP